MVARAGHGEGGRDDAVGEGGEETLQAEHRHVGVSDRGEGRWRGGGGGKGGRVRGGVPRVSRVDPRGDERAAVAVRPLFRLLQTPVGQSPVLPLPMRLLDAGRRLGVPGFFPFLLDGGVHAPAHEAESRHADEEDEGEEVEVVPRGEAGMEGAGVRHQGEEGDCQAAEPRPSRVGGGIALGECGQVGREDHARAAADGAGEKGEDEEAGAMGYALDRDLGLPVAR